MSEGPVPRRTPASLRPRPRGWGRPWVHCRDVPRLSGAANAAVRALERERLTPGIVSVALSVRSVRVHGSKRRWGREEAEFACPCCGEAGLGTSRKKLCSCSRRAPPPSSGYGSRASMRCCSGERITSPWQIRSCRGGTADAERFPQPPWDTDSSPGGVVEEALDLTTMQGMTRVANSASRGARSGRWL